MRVRSTLRTFLTWKTARVLTLEAVTLLNNDT